METDTTRRLLGADGFGRPHIGHRALTDVDLADARIRSGPFTLPPSLARLRLKQWQHFCFVSPEALVTLAVVDTVYLGVAWCQVVDLKTGERFEHRRQRPFADLGVARSLWDDRTWFRAAGFRVEIHSHLSEHRHVVEVDIDGDGDAPAVRGTLTCDHDPEAVDSMVVNLPVGRGRFFYSHKVCLPVSGSLAVGAEERGFDSGRSVAILDIHKGHYPRHTWWNWATCAGRDREGRLVGMNLTRNLVVDDATWNENVCWVAGEAHRLGPAIFELDAGDRFAPWRLSTSDGAVELMFEPRGGRGEDIDIPVVVRSRFHQLYGKFAGRIRVDEAEVVIDDLWGLCEDHDAVW